MEIVNHNITMAFQPRPSPESGFNDKDPRVKTSQRMFYEAQVHVIQRQIGDLEALRSKFGLSARKMCQLLLVDPSAWTRWKAEGAPPHVWRALQWYSILHEKIPGLTPQYFTGKDPEVLNAETLQKLKQTKNEISELVSEEVFRLENRDIQWTESMQSQIRDLEAKLSFHRIMIYGLLLMGAGLALALILRP